MHVSTTYISNQSCQAIWDVEWKEDIMDDSMMCTINENPYRNACLGDSGGPLYDKEANRVVGVTSWGDSACESFPVVFAKIATAVSQFTNLFKSF